MSQFVVVEKVHMDIKRIACHTPFYVHLCMLLDWRSLLAIQLLETIRLAEHVFIHLVGCLTMAFISAM
jgi:hypothetical protein